MSSEFELHEPIRAEEEMITISDARELAERAWVERSGRERGDLELTKFQDRAARSQFNRWWDLNVSNE